MNKHRAKHRMPGAPFLFLSFFCALVLPASCSKAEGPDGSGFVPDSGQFRASISSNFTKTALDASTGKLSWELTDTITVKDAASASSKYTVRSIDPESGVATFQYLNGTRLGDGPFSATYGAAPAKTQKYSETPGKFYMTASSPNHFFTFKTQSAVLKLNLTKSDANIVQIKVFGVPDGQTAEQTYTLECPDTVSISSGRNFYIALPPGQYDRIVLKNEFDMFSELISYGVRLDTNSVKHIVVNPPVIDFKRDVTAIATQDYKLNNDV